MPVRPEVTREPKKRKRTKPTQSSSWSSSSIHELLLKETTDNDVNNSTFSKLSLKPFEKQTTKPATLVNVMV